MAISPTAIPVTADGAITIHAQAVDAQGNISTPTDVTVTVDTTPANLLGAITVPDDLNGDGIINASELGADGALMPVWHWVQMQRGYCRKR